MSCSFRVGKSMLLAVLLLASFLVLQPALIFAHESTPEASPVASAEPYDPARLFDALIQSEFPQEYWPSAAVSAVAAPWASTDATLEGTVAAVQITFEGSEQFGIAYAIYATEAEAAAALERAATEHGGLATPSALPAEVEAPGVILDYGSFKVCLVQVNNVLIDGAALDVDSAVALARIGVEYLGQVVETMPAPEATPLAGASPFDAVSPEELRDRLLASEFTGTGVPSALQNPQVAEWVDESDTDLVGSTGAATVSFTGGDGGIAYIIFPNSTWAKLRLRESVANERALGNDPVEPSDLAYPALILSDGEGVTCVLQVDYALVAGYAPIGDAGAEAATQDAVALALAGAEHLVNLAESN